MVDDSIVELISVALDTPKCDHVFHRIWEDLHIVPSNYRLGVENLCNYGNQMDIEYLVQDTENKLNQDLK